MKPEEINNLPENVRKYIHHLETDADPAGTLRENFFLKQQVAALEILVSNEKEERKHQVYCAALNGLLSNSRCVPMDNASISDMRVIARRIANAYES